MVFHVKRESGARGGDHGRGANVEGTDDRRLDGRRRSDAEVFVGQIRGGLRQSGGAVSIDFDATTNTTLAALSMGRG